MAQTSRVIPGAAVRGMASGVLFMAFFGTLWATIGVGALQGLGTPWVLIVALLIGIGLLVGGVILLRESQRLGEEAGGDDQEGRRIGIWFGAIFGLEGVSILIASIVCNATGHFDLFFSIMAIIVGLHFLPLAWLFDYRAHYVAGTLLCLIGIVAMLVVPASGTLGTREIQARSLVVGFGCAVILWGTGLVLWRQGRHLLGGTTPA